MRGEQPTTWAGVAVGLLVCALWTVGTGEPAKKQFDNPFVTKPSEGFEGRNGRRPTPPPPSTQPKAGPTSLPDMSAIERIVATWPVSKATPANQEAWKKSLVGKTISETMSLEMFMLTVKKQAGLQVTRYGMPPPYQKSMCAAVLLHDPSLDKTEQENLALLDKLKRAVPIGTVLTFSGRIESVLCYTRTSNVPGNLELEYCELTAAGSFPEPIKHLAGLASKPTTLAIFISVIPPTFFEEMNPDQKKAWNRGMTGQAISDSGTVKSIGPDNSVTVAASPVIPGKGPAAVACEVSIKFGPGGEAKLGGISAGRKVRYSGQLISWQRAMVDDTTGKASGKAVSGYQLAVTGTSIALE